MIVEYFFAAPPLRRSEPQRAHGPDVRSVANLPYMAAVCDICGKVLRSASAEAMAAHKRESQSCTRVKTKGASGEVTSSHAHVSSFAA